MIAIAGLGIPWNSIQTWLLPILKDELGELDQKHRDIASEIVSNESTHTRTITTADGICVFATV